MLEDERTDGGKEVGCWEGMPTGQTKIYLKLHNWLVLTIIMINNLLIRNAHVYSTIEVHLSITENQRFLQ